MFDNYNESDEESKSIPELVKQLLNECNEIRQIKNKFLETIELSLDDYNRGNIPDTYFIQDHKTYISDFQKDTKINEYCIDNITKQLENLFSESDIENSTGIVKPIQLSNRYPISYCLYQGHCPDCLSGSINQNEAIDYCLNCTTCNTFRELAIKRVKENAKEIYNTHINPKNAIVKATKNQPKIINQTINNMYVQCESVNINIEQNYYLTNDNLFYVTVEVNLPTQEEMVKKLKYIFTCLMCGSKGKYLFPNEEKHSRSSSYPVSAALYTIKNIENKPILHGLLKYEKNDTSSVMTLKKLHNINKSNIAEKRPIIKASFMPLWEEKKGYYCVKSLQDTVKTITSTTHYGSSIDDFLN